jgi:hypothetical protein
MAVIDWHLLHCRELGHHCMQCSICIVQCKWVKGEHILRPSENRVVKKMLRFKKKVMRGWRKL